MHVCASEQRADRNIKPNSVSNCLSIDGAHRIRMVSFAITHLFVYCDAMRSSNGECSLSLISDDGRLFCDANEPIRDQHR